MYYKILKKDLKRKKAMNIILFIFMLTASTLIAASSNLLYSTVTAVDYFIEKSDVADMISMTNAEEGIIKSIDEWTKQSDKVKDYLGEDVIMLDDKDVILPTGVELNDSSNMMIMAKPKKYNLVYDKTGNDFQIKKSQIAIPVSMQKKLGLTIGDNLTIGIEGYEKEFEVGNIFKDAVFGSELMGMKRVILCEEDFHEFLQKASPEIYLKLWGFTKNDGYDNKTLQDEFSSLMLPTYTIIVKDLVSTTYIFDMVLAIVMIIVSIFLILISFLILRFTIVFTVMEDYKQIGVMKAIGLSNRKVRGLYIFKYLMLSVSSGMIGLLISIPVSELMKKNISEFIILKETPMNMVIACLSVLAVVGVTLLYCNYSTAKIKKISAIDAIRQGNTGERFKNTKKMRLHQHKFLKVPLFLAWSDIISDFKKFLILIITYILGTAIIIIPNNILSTLTSEDAISLFGYIKSDFYIRDALIGNQEDANRRMEELNVAFDKLEVQTDLRADLITTCKVYTLDKSESLGALSLQGIRVNSDQYSYLEGTSPQLLNEIAITEKVAEYLGVSIGDSILCELQGDSNEFIVTGLFQTFNQLGNAVRVAEGYTSENGSSTSITISGKLTGTKEEKEVQFTNLKDTFPRLEIKSAEDLVTTFIGDIAKQLKAVEKLILILVLSINFLITTLLLRMLLSKEIPEIAILKSLGFHTATVKLWQVYRLGIILVTSILLGAVFANMTGNVISSGIFRIMGVTRLQLAVEPLKVYVVYPFVLFTITIIAVLSSLGQIKKTHVWELNNQE
jgi:putative ABC transport system permease protein